MSIHRFDFAATTRPRALPAQGSSPEAEALKWGLHPLEAMEAARKARQARMMGLPRVAPVVVKIADRNPPETPENAQKLGFWRSPPPPVVKAMPPPVPRIPTMIRKIQLAVAQEFGVGVEALVSHARSAEIITPRFIAIHLCRELTKKSLAIIGRAFSGRDHSTVGHAVRVARERLANEPGFAARVAAVRERLGFASASSSA